MNCDEQKLKVNEALHRLKSEKEGSIAFVDYKLLLDTLFLALPVSWRGTIQQYAGRLHRLHARKRIVQVFDYVDVNVPVLSRMYERRLKTQRGPRRLLR